jgi:hypothetical protein
MNFVNELRVTFINTIKYLICLNKLCKFENIKKSKRLLQLNDLNK